MLNTKSPQIPIVPAKLSPVPTNIRVSPSPITRLSTKLSPTPITTKLSATPITTKLSPTPIARSPTAKLLTTPTNIEILPTNIITRSPTTAKLLPTPTNIIARSPTTTTKLSPIPIKSADIPYPMIYNSFADRILASDASLLRAQERRIINFNEQNLLTPDDFDELIRSKQYYENKLIILRDDVMDWYKRSGSLDLQFLLDRLEDFVNRYCKYSEDLKIIVNQITQNIDAKNDYCEQFDREECSLPCEPTTFIKGLFTSECVFPVKEADIKQKINQI